MRLLQTVTLLILTGMLLLSTSCASDRSLVPATGHPLTIESIRNDPTAFSGKGVTLTAVFRGWLGRCTGRPPVSRSDWMIEDDTGCIYVHGSLPGGLQATAPRSERLSLGGIIRVSKDGLPYLDLGNQ